MRAKLSYANVVATLALMVAVAGGSTAIAMNVGKNSVKASSIKAGNVTAPRAGWRQNRPGYIHWLHACCRALHKGPAAQRGRRYQWLERRPCFDRVWAGRKQLVGTRDRLGCEPKRRLSSAVALCLKAKPGR